MGNQPRIITNHQAAIHAAQVYRQRSQTRRTIILRPASSALVEVVEELVQAPPTDEELRVLTDMSAAAETLVEAKVEVQLAGTRLLKHLRILTAKSKISISDAIMILIMVYHTYLMLHPQQPTPPPPQVTVIVTVPTPTVDTNEIVKQIQERIEQERDEHQPPEPTPERQGPR